MTLVQNLPSASPPGLKANVVIQSKPFCTAESGHNVFPAQKGSSLTGNRHLIGIDVPHTHHVVSSPQWTNGVTRLPQILALGQLRPARRDVGGFKMQAQYFGSLAVKGTVSDVMGAVTDILNHGRRAQQVILPLRSKFRNRSHRPHEIADVIAITVIKPVRVGSR